MTTKNHLSLASAVAAHVQAPPREISAADILLSFRRELVPKDVEGLGRVYVYEPVSVTERDAYQKHMRYDGDGLSVPMGGIVDGIIARVRDKAGTLLFKESDKDKLLQMPAETALSIWHAIGGDSAKPLSSEMVDDAGKK